MDPSLEAAKRLAHNGQSFWQRAFIYRVNIETDSTHFCD